MAERTKYMEERFQKMLAGKKSKGGQQQPAAEVEPDSVEPPGEPGYEIADNKPKRQQIKKVSDKRKELNKEYAATTRPLWQGKKCRIRSPKCTSDAQGMHHLEGKETAEKLLNVDKQVPACNACNLYVEENHAWAVENGWKLKRNTATTRYKNSYKPDGGKKTEGG